MVLLEIASTTDYLNVFIVSLVMMIISILFSKKFGLPIQQQVEIQQKLRDLQEEMKLAQGDIYKMQEIQKQSIELMRIITKKQLLPMCIRTITFFGVYFVMSSFYIGVVFDKNPLPIFGYGFFSLYFLYSIGLSLINLLINFLIKKIRKKPISDDSIIYDPLLNYKLNIPESQLNSTKYNNKDDIKLDELSDELIQLHKDLVEKQKQGLIPKDIDLNEEIKRIQKEENLMKIENKINKDENENKLWKEKIQNDKKEIDLNE